MPPRQSQRLSVGAYLIDALRKGGDNHDYGAERSIKVYTEQALRNGRAFKQLADVGIDPHWTGSDFDKVEKASDELFKKKGWIL